MQFCKYSATGNDFIITSDVPDDLNSFCLNVPIWCDRKNGIGADGVIILKPSTQASFEMIIINADGSIAEMCGNGLRAIAHYARYVAHIPYEDHYLIVCDEKKYFARNITDNQVEIEMSYVNQYNEIHIQEIMEPHFFVDTGVPHLVIEVKNLDEVDVFKLGRYYRNHHAFKRGSNINFVQLTAKDVIRVRTFERGVEDETDSCGTGVFASFLAMLHWNKISNQAIIKTRGGEINIRYQNQCCYYQAPIKKVFDGTI
jgi:diaminopimelate epimerase